MANAMSQQTEIEAEKKLTKEDTNLRMAGSQLKPGVSPAGSSSAG